MYLPMCFPKSEYSEEGAIQRYNKYLEEGNLRVLNSVGLVVCPWEISIKDDEHEYTIALDQGRKYDMTDEARVLFGKFLEQVQIDFNNKTLEERKEFV